MKLKSIVIAPMGCGPRAARGSDDDPVAVTAVEFTGADKNDVLAALNSK